MSDVMPGPGWWLASDGKWYPPESRDETSEDLVAPQGVEQPEGPGWWLASDGKWYPPTLRPDPEGVAGSEQALGKSDVEVAVEAPVAAALWVPVEVAVEAPTRASWDDEATIDASVVEPASTTRAESGRLETPVVEPASANWGAATSIRGLDPAISDDSPRLGGTARGVDLGSSRARSVKGASGYIGGTSESTQEFEESTALRYVGFVPDPGPEAEIRPELREPLAVSQLTETFDRNTSSPAIDVPGAPGAPGAAPTAVVDVYRSTRTRTGKWLGEDHLESESRSGEDALPEGGAGPLQRLLGRRRGR